MSSAALLFCLTFPALLAGALWLPATARPALRLAPWAAAPALIFAMTAPQGQVDIPWLMLGTTLGIDETRRIFLLLTAGLWTAAGVYAGAYHAEDSRRRSYFTFHLLALAGNLGLVAALDAPTFYLGFVIMSLAAYGMVIHAGSQEARHAARVYIVLVLAGEAMILPGLWAAVTHAPTTALSDVALGAAEAGPWAVALLAAGFGVKAGVVPLHLWLPLAHPAAPTPASAVLSGAMIKAGVLAWIGLLPFGHAALEGFAAIFVIAGFVNAFFGAAAGVCQSRPKTVLAYSSISQIGLIMIAIGAAFLGGDTTTSALAAATLYCLHHAAAKGALFLGVGVVERTEGNRRNLALAALALPALALAGLPLTSGYGAKLALKEAAHALPAYAALAELLLGIAAIGTTLIMARFMMAMARTPVAAATSTAAMPTSWLALIAAGLLIAWLPGAPAAAWTYLADRAALWSALWPILAGLALSGIALLAARRGAAPPPIPEGDLAVPATAALNAAGRLLRQKGERRRAWQQAAAEATGSHLARLRRRSLSWAVRGERGLMRSPVAALNLLALIALLIVLAAAG